MYDALVREIARILVTDIAAQELSNGGQINRSGPGWNFILVGGPLGVAGNFYVSVKAMPDAVQAAVVPPETPPPPQV